MIRKLTRFIKALLIAAGIVAIALVALCFTPAPWHLYHWLGSDAFALGRDGTLRFLGEAVAKLTASGKMFEPRLHIRASCAPYQEHR